MGFSKTLIRAGASMATGFLNRAFLTSPKPFLPPKPELIAAPKLLPSLFIPQSQKLVPFQFSQPQDDAESIKKLSSEGFLYLSGLHSLPFLLPKGVCALPRMDCFEAQLRDGAIGLLLRL